MLKKIVDFFTISKVEGIALICLSLFVLLVAVLSFELPYIFKEKPAEPISDSLKEQLANLISSDTTHKNKYFSRKPFNKNEKHALTPFSFDPNTLSESGFLKLGLPEFTVSTILNYRNKGGQFYTIADMQKMYSLSTPDFESLKNYIKIAPRKQNPAFTNSKYVREVVHCELNTSDTAQLNKLKGIGSAFAKRIVELRTNLGGFYSSNQLLEVYGLEPDLLESLKPNISVDKSQIKRININEVSFQLLSEHPYFRNGVALAICKYRKLKASKIETISEISSLPECTPEVIEKIKNYIKF